MQLQGGQSGAAGPNANVEFIARMAQYTIPAAATVNTGQCFSRDLTQLSGYPSTSSGGCPTVNLSAAGGQPDMVVLPTSANAGDFYGAYQGPPITNPGTTPLVVLLPLQWSGYGLVLAQAPFGGTAVVVGCGLTLVAATINPQFVAAGSRAIGLSVGRALATVIAGTLVSAVGGTLITVPGSGANTAVLNVDIQALG